MLLSTVSTLQIKIIVAGREKIIISLRVEFEAQTKKQSVESITTG